MSFLDMHAAEQAEWGGRGGGSRSDGSSCSVPSLCAELAVSRQLGGQLRGRAGLPSNAAHHVTGELQESRSAHSAYHKLRGASWSHICQRSCSTRPAFDCSGLPLKLLSSNFDSSLRGILVQQMERFSNLFNSTYPSAKRARRKDGKKMISGRHLKRKNKGERGNPAHLTTFRSHLDHHQV